jgi:hypothetical protein
MSKNVVEKPQKNTKKEHCKSERHGDKDKGYSEKLNDVQYLVKTTESEPAWLNACSNWQ